MTTKAIILRAFKIKPSSDLFCDEKGPAETLLEKLQSSKTADERRLSLNDRSNTKEQDLIANFCAGTIKKSVHCLMVRLAIGNTGRQVSDALLQQGSFDLKDLGLDNSDVDGTKAPYHQSHYYFCLTNEYLVTTLPINKTIAGLQAYLNWYVNRLYEITPLINTQVISKLTDVSFVEFQDGRLFKKSRAAESSLLDLATEYLKDIFKDAKTVDDAILSKHISATLKITIKKPKTSESDRVQQTFGAILKPIADLDNVVLHTKGTGKIAKGDEILQQKIVQIDQLDNGLVNEPALRQAMELFLQEIEKCKSTSKE